MSPIHVKTWISQCVTKSYNNMAYNILENEIHLILPQIPRKKKHAIITTLVSSFIGLAYEGISSFLHHKWNKALHKVVRDMDSKATIQCNMFMQLENSMLMYGAYNTEMLEKLINNVHNIHNTNITWRDCLQDNRALWCSDHFMHIP